MNRLTWKMVESLRNARMFPYHHVNDVHSRRAFKHWMREFQMYHALCRCIRRGYKPVREVDE